MTSPVRHPASRFWSFPPSERPPIAAPFERTNLRELAARPSRFEHHLMVCATVDGVELEVVVASEPLYFAHVNATDEYAVALETGDSMVDAMPLRTFLSSASSGDDVGRYNHRALDLVLHAEGALHWPGRLRPPYAPFPFPPGERRTALSLVYCAIGRAPHEKPIAPPIDAQRSGDVKASVDGAVDMALVPLREASGAIARIGATRLAVVSGVDRIAPPNGGWVVVLEGEAVSAHAPMDLVRVPNGESLDARGIRRALVLDSERAEPDPIPPLWSESPAPPFAPFEDAVPGALPFALGELVVREASPTNVAVSVGSLTSEVPRYWLARMLFRVALHGVRLGYVETYGGLFVDDRGDGVRVGLRNGTDAASVEIPRADTLGAIERLYRAVAPGDYRERLD